jgi:hypothetical protein
LEDYADALADTAWAARGIDDQAAFRLAEESQRIRQLAKAHREAEALRERQCGSAGLHGEDPQTAEVAP